MLALLTIHRVEKQVPNGRRHWRWTPIARKLTYAAAVVARLKDLAPYALIELVVPGGSLMALALWLYRRQKKTPVFQTHEILSLL
jgi:hypothetical protein